MTAERDALAALIRDRILADQWGEVEPEEFCDLSTEQISVHAPIPYGEIADAILAAGWRPIGDLRARIAKEEREADEQYDVNSAASYRQVLRMIDGICDWCDHQAHADRCSCGCRGDT